jgi:hypothetical protein
VYLSPLKTSKQLHVITEEKSYLGVMARMAYIH